ncbi:hypothetical protein ADS77_21440, partial [Pseudoalteromonas porphyrae]
QHGALLELAAVRLQYQIGGGVHQRVHGMDQVGHGLARQAHVLLLEADALVLAQHRSATLTDHAIALADGGGHMAHLVAAWLPGPQLSTQNLEGLGEEGADEVRLQLAGLGLLHLLLHRIELVEPHMLLDQGIAADDLAQVVGIQGTLDHLLQARLHLGRFAVADRLHQ